MAHGPSAGVRQSRISNLSPLDPKTHMLSTPSVMCKKLGVQREKQRGVKWAGPDSRGSRRQRPRVRAGVVGRDVNTGTEAVPRSPGE